MSENALQTIPTAALTTADNLSNIKGLAQVFVASGLFEDTKDISQAFVKILKGQELGFPPVNSMELIDIIGKRLFLKPKGIGAKINSCGYGAYKAIERNAERCIIRFSRKTRDGWEDLELIEYTLEIAKARGLTNKPEWKTDPANMLFWRCLGRGGAAYFPELMAGLAPTPDHASEPVSDDTYERNVVDMFGDTVDRRTGEVIEQPPPGEVANGTILASASPPTGPLPSSGEQNSGEDGPLRLETAPDPSADVTEDTTMHWHQSLGHLVDTAAEVVLTAVEKLGKDDALMTEMATLSGMVKRTQDCLAIPALDEHRGRNLHMTLQAQLDKAEEEKVA